jgi:hypothetical protein
MDSAWIFMAAFVIVVDIRNLMELWRSHRETQRRHDMHMRWCKWNALQVQRKRIYR